MTCELPTTPATVFEVSYAVAPGVSSQATTETVARSQGISQGTFMIYLQRTGEGRAGGRGRKDGDGDGEEGDLEMAWPPRDKLRSGAHGGQPPKVTLHDGSVHAAPSNMKTPPRRDHGRTTNFEV